MKQHTVHRGRIGAALPLLAGLICAQAVATLFVRQSNELMLKQIQALTAAGWMAIPAGPAVAGLKTWGAALRGGLFYTLSVGAGLTLLTWAAVGTWQKLLRPDHHVLKVFSVIWLIVFAGVWMGMFVAVNLNGYTLFPSLFIILIPICTSLAAVRRGPSAEIGSTRWLFLIPVLSMVLLTGLWTAGTMVTHLKADLFIAIRDNILLSNPMGRKINDFYYRNTLYAAQTFKSFNQKTIRVYRALDFSDSRLAQRLDAALTVRDILKVPAPCPADMVVRQSQGNLHLESAFGDELDVASTEFFKDPNRWLAALSDLSDRFAPLRRLTLYTLLIAFPTLLFILVYGVLYFGAGTFLAPRKAVPTASALCLVIGLGLFIPMLQGRPAVVGLQDINSALASSDWHRCVAALRQIEKHKIDIVQYPQYRRLLRSPLVVQRYWLARALAVSHSAATYADLLAMTADPHPNVVCQAYFALGQRGNPAAIQRIRKQMLQSNHWYTQWYGYHALRKLGWHQQP